MYIIFTHAKNYAEANMHGRWPNVTHAYRYDGRVDRETVDARTPEDHRATIVRPYSRDVCKPISAELFFALRSPANLLSVLGAADTRAPHG